MERNPFTPAFGTMPMVLAGRDELIERMSQAFANGPGDPNLSMIAIGPRGSGKTVLLSRIREIASHEGWITASTTALPGMLEDLYEQCCIAGEHLVSIDSGTRLKSVTIGPLSASWENAPARSGNWRTRMTRLLEQLAAYDAGLLITVDEATADLDEMVRLAATYQHFVTERRKVSLVMAGLPYHAHRLVTNKSISFLRRSAQEDLGRISDADVEAAFNSTVRDAGKTVRDDALDLCVQAIEGFPYMLQLVGYRAWLASDPDAEIDGKAAERGIREARHEIEERILAATYRELSRGDIRFLRAMLPDTKESHMSDIAERMGVKYNYAANYKKRLLAQGVIGEPATGVVRFEIPGFRDYVADRV